jgi:hypothetical protein
MIPGTKQAAPALLKRIEVMICEAHKCLGADLDEMNLVIAPRDNGLDELMDDK